MGIKQSFGSVFCKPKDIFVIINMPILKLKVFLLLTISCSEVLQRKKKTNHTSEIFFSVLTGPFDHNEVSLSNILASNVWIYEQWSRQFPFFSSAWQDREFSHA